MLDRERTQTALPNESVEAQIRHLIQKRTSMLQSGVYTQHDLLIRQLDERINQLLVHEAFDNATARPPPSANFGTGYIPTSAPAAVAVATMD